MSITAIGQQGYQDAQARLADASRRLVERGPDAESIVDLKSAEQQAELATKLIKTGIEVDDALLDILA